MSQQEALEMAVIDLCLARHGLPAPWRDPQGYRRRVALRDIAGSGFITSFVASDAPRLFPEGVTGDVSGPVEGVLTGDETFGVGFVLMIGRGRLRYVEGFSYGGEMWPPSLSGFTIGGGGG